MPVSVDDTDDHRLAGSGDARVDDDSLVDDSDVWKATAMRDHSRRCLC